MATAARLGVVVSIVSRHLATILAAGVLLIGLTVRLALLPTPGYDVEAYQSWTQGVYEFGVSSAYRLELDPWYNYPPGYLYVLWATSRLFLVLASQPDWSGPLLSALLKLPPILADVSTGGVLFLFLRGRVRMRWALMATAAYVLNPAVLWNTAYWGGIDALHTLFLLAALMAATADRPQFSWPLACCSLLIKPLGAPAALVVAAVALLRFDVRRVLLGTLASLFVVVLAGLPFLWEGKLREMLTALSGNVGNFAALSANAHNFWWLFAGGNVWRDDGVSVLGPLSYRGLGFLLFGLASLGPLSRLRRGSDVGTIFAVAAALQLSLFIWLTEVHENWSYAAFALLCIAAALRPSLRPLYVLLSLTFLSNLALQDHNLEPFWNSLNGQGLVDSLRWMNALAYVLLAAGFVASLAIGSWGERGERGKGEKGNASDLNQE